MGPELHQEAVLAHVNTTETSAAIQSSFPHGNERTVQQKSRSLEHIQLTFPQHPKCKTFSNSGNSVQFFPGLPTAGLHSQVSSCTQFRPPSLSLVSSHELERASRAACGILSTPQSRRQRGHPTPAMPHRLQQVRIWDTAVGNTTLARGQDTPSQSIFKT